MRVVVPVDMKWDERAFLKAVKGADRVKVVVVVDDELLSLSVELAAEKGWLGDGTVSKLFEVLKEQMERMGEEYEKKATELLEKKGIPFDFEHVEGNFKEAIFKVAGERPGSVVFVHKKGYNPYWQVVKPVVHDLCKRLRNCRVI